MRRILWLLILAPFVAVLADEPGVVRTEVGVFDLRLGTPGFPSELRTSIRLDELAAQHFLLAVDGPLETLRERIVSAGGAFVAEAGNSIYVVRLNAGALAAIRSDPAVLALEPYHPGFKLSPSIGSRVGTGVAVATLHVLVFPGQSAAAVAAEVRKLGGNVLGIAPDMVRVELSTDKLATLASLEAVFRILEEAPVVPWGDETNLVVQVGGADPGANPYHDAHVNGGGARGTCSVSTQLVCQGALDCPGAETCVGAGSPQVLMTLDTGIQLDAGDLSDTRTSAGTPGPSHRKVRVYETTAQFSGSIQGGGDDRGCDDPTSGSFTHGHVVASVALGNATAVPLDYGPGWEKRDARGVLHPVDGVAPRAVLVAYDALTTAQFGSCTDPIHGGLAVGDIYTGEGGTGSLETAYHAHGARTFDFSWGTSANHVYGTNAGRVDGFLFDSAHADAMLFLAAGDEGEDYGYDGPDPFTISEPATAKNAVVVGGSGNSAPFAGYEYHQGEETTYFLTTGEDSRYWFSGTGPATSASLRTAPILMAPATDFHSEGHGFDSEYACRSNDDDQSGPVECDVILERDGTSFASAAAAGAALLVRDYFAQGFYPDGTSGNPGNAADQVTTLSGAAVKAMLVASADWMNRFGPNGGPSNLPGGNLSARHRFNHEQGYGRIQLDNVLPLQSWAAAPPGLILADGGTAGGRLDVPGLTGDLDTGAGETDTGSFTVCDDMRELRVALAWLDSPGEVLNRNLDLELRAPSGKIYYGNYFTDDNNRNGKIDAGEDCPDGHLTGSFTSLDASPWSLETCANAPRDTRNPTEAIFLSPDARLDGTLANADRQTEAGPWTVLVRTGAGSAAAVQPYALVIAGGVCVGSSIRLDRAIYACDEAARIVVDERDEPADPLAGLTDAEVASRTSIEVVDPGADRALGSADDQVVDVEDGSSGLSFGHAGTRYESSLVLLTDGAAARPHDGLLEVRDRQGLRVTYRDETGGVPDPAKVRGSLSTAACSPDAVLGGVVFAQLGFDTSQLVEGGCERDARGLFTFGYPDRYLDAGERAVLRIAFQNQGAEDLEQVRVSLRCVLADANSPEGCRPGTSECADPERRDNAPCGAMLRILDSPKEIGSLPAGAVASPSFAIEVGTIAGTPEVDLLLGVAARGSGRSQERLLALRNTLNADEQSFFYSTDFPTGGTQVRDWPASSTADSSNEVPDDPVTDATDPVADYRFDTVQWSSLRATGRNLDIVPWDFESGRQGWSVGLNNTTNSSHANDVANWGEDRNFNGVLDYHCSGSPTIVCPGRFPLRACGRCQNSTTTICTDAADCTAVGGGSCDPSAPLGACVSDEDRDPVNGVLDDNWSTAGGCGWQTNGTSNSPSTPGGVWHTGRIGPPWSPCLVAGQASGACQSYETLGGNIYDRYEWEILLSPEFHKVNQCTTDLGPLPAACGGRHDGPEHKVFTVEFMNWAWNMAVDLRDYYVTMPFELDTDTRTASPVDLFGDTEYPGIQYGHFGPVTWPQQFGTPPPRWFPTFAPGPGAASNGAGGRNRVGQNPCYFDSSTLTPYYRLAQPRDDDVDDDGDGQVDEYVEPNGPIRNSEIASFSNSSYNTYPYGVLDMRNVGLEDLYGPSGESFRAGVGFRVEEPYDVPAQAGFGAAVDDMVVEWREFKLVEDATNCSTSGSCALVELDTGHVYDGYRALGITVVDSSPYRCTGGPPCTPEGKNDCDHDGSFSGLIDDADCDDDGLTDVVVKVVSGVELSGEYVVLNRVAATDSYHGTLPVAIGQDVPGVLRIAAYSVTASSGPSVRYDDHWDGTASGAKCPNAAHPAASGSVSAAANVIESTGDVRVRSFRVDDLDGDRDGFPDTGETADLYVTILNTSGLDLTNVTAFASTSDPKVDCLLRSAVQVGFLAAGATVELPVPFTFHVAGSADRTGVAPPVACTAGACSNGAGSCAATSECPRTLDDSYAATFAIAISADQFETNLWPQQVVLDLDLDARTPVAPTAGFSEGFESGFGNFILQNIDFNIASNSASNGYRCQYQDPDFRGSNSYGDTECYLGFQAGQTPNNDWHVHTTTAPDGGRAYAGNRSLHYGKHTPGNAGLDTYGLSQLDALRTKSGINLAARICRDDPSPSKRSCNAAADCAAVGGGPCIGASPELSFKHQISTIDYRSTGTPWGQAADRAVVQARLQTASTWKNLVPFQNVYDVQGTDNFSNCLFDPADDGNDEDDYFDPTDPNRRLGPSSTCFPEFVFSYLGDTDAPFDPTAIGRASDGPGLHGSLGKGTWVESSFDLSRYRGRAVSIRYLFTSIKVSDRQTHEEVFMWNPMPGDDGWYVDDIRVSQTLGSGATTVTADVADNSALPGCGAPCNTLSATLGASPASSPAPGQVVRLLASALADRCASGVLLYQYWLDGNADGALGHPSDRLLRDYGLDPRFDDAPLATTSYLVRVVCSSATSPPCSGVLAARTVSVSCPGPAFAHAYDAAAWWTRLRFTSKVALSVPASSTHPRLDVARGDLAALRASGVLGGETCLASESYSTSFADGSNPGTGNGFYYLARDADPVCDDNSSWSTYHPREWGGRDEQVTACPP